MRSTLRSLAVLFGFFLSIQVNAQNCTVNAGIPQTICANSTLTLTGQTNGSFTGGTPTITWSQLSGTPTTITSPNSSSTTVTGFTTGTYVYQISTTCLDGSNITDNVTITVRPVVLSNAGPDVTYCPGTYALAGNTASPGTGTWTVIGTNNGVTIGSTNSATSNITLNPANSGNTTLRWTINQTTSGTTCSSIDDVIITNRGGISTINAGADITLNNCYTTTHSTTLAASFAGTTFGQQGTWSQVSGPNTATIASVNAANSGVSNLVQGVYVFRWTVAGACVNGSDEVQVTVPAPTSGLTSIGNLATQGFCDGRTSTVLTATQPSFSGETAVWTVVSGSGTFSSPTNYTTNVSGIGAGANTYRYTITNATGCSAFKDVIVNNVAPPAVTISTPSPVQLSCASSSTTINFTASGGTGNTQFRVIAAPTGYTLPGSWSNTNTSTSFNLTGLTTPGTYLVRVMRTGTSDCNAVTQDITVITSQTPTLSNAGTDQLLACNVTTTALAGNIPSVGTGSWSQINGPNTAVIANPAQYNTNISGLIPGAYDFKWIINAGNGCTPSENVVTVRVASTTPTAADAGPDRLGICHTGPVQLAGNIPALNEVGTWSVSPSAGISFNNVNDPNAIVTGMVANTSYTFTWTLVNGCGSAADNMVISTSGTQGAGQANAGADRCLAAATTSLTMAATAASPAGAAGTWTLVSGPNTPTIVTPTSATTSITGLTQGTYLFAWSVTAAGCGAVSDTMIATISPTVTVANAGAAQAICGNTVTLAANSPTVGSGIWSQVSGPGGATISNATNNNTSVTGLGIGLYRFRWTISSGACSSISDVNITVSGPSTTATVAADSTCITRTLLNSMTGNAPASGIGTWSQVSGPNVATITTTSSPTSGLSGLINGNYVFRWTIAGASGCPSTSADMQVSVNMPTSSIGNINVCNITSVTLTGNTNIGGTWSQTSGPSSSSIQAGAPNIATVTGLQPGVYNFQFTPTSVTGCSALTPRTVVLTNNAPATPSNAGTNQSLCNVTSFGLTGNAPSVGTGAWSRISGPNTPTISSASAVAPTISGAINGLYTYRWTITNGGCASAQDVTILISAPATTANAGPTQTICSDAAAVSLNGNSPTTGTGVWSQVSGPAPVSFTNASLNTTGVSGLSTAGVYGLRWTISNGACSNNSQMNVQVDAAPVANAGANTTVYANNYTLQATTPAAGTGTWSQVNGPSSGISDLNAPNATVTGLQIGNSYTYRWTVTNGSVCAPATSDVILTVSPPLPLTMVSFSGFNQYGKARLQWKVANEIDVDHFEVERSSDGLNYVKIGVVPAGNSSANYAFQELLAANVANAFYRLKIVDVDGRFEYSSIVRIYFGQKASEVIVVPNPVQGNIVVRINHTINEQAVLFVVNSVGQVAYRYEYRIGAGNQVFVLPGTDRLPAGAYQIRVVTASGVLLQAKALMVGVK